MSNDEDARRIEALAYQIWEAEGRPEGRHADHWIEAQRRLRRDVNSQESAAGKASGLAPDDDGDGDQQDSPGRPKSASTREQTHRNQTTQTGSAELDGRAAAPPNSMRRR
jgi:hypothetical protein